MTTNSIAHLSDDSLPAAPGPHVAARAAQGGHESVDAPRRDTGVTESVATDAAINRGGTTGSLSAERASSQRPQARLGEMLLACGALTLDQLDCALAKQRGQKLPLGQLLVQLGFVTDEAMRMALAAQLGIPFIDLDKVIIDRHLARQVNRSFARRHLLLPVAQVDRTITIAMDDPTSRSLVDDIARLTGLTVNVVTCSTRSIHRALRRLYSDDAGSGEGLVLTETAATTSGSAGLEEQVSRRADELFQQVLARAVHSRCSDIHMEMFATGLHVRFRIDGVLRAPDFGLGQQALDRNMREIISRIKILAKLDIAERRRPQDGSFQVAIDRAGKRASVDLRVSAIPSHSGESVVIRLLDRGGAPRGLDALRLGRRMTAGIENALRRTTGIFLVTGPTGSGKSTTLYACLMRLHRPGIRILTAEDPVEYVYDELSQSEVNDDIGNTFAAYLRAFLRHDPEVIMIGEIRDEETAEMAFRAAQTGHLLLSTLHTNSAIEALPRLLDLKIDSSLVASSLIGVMSQRLARQVCADCQQRHTPDAPLLREFFGDAEPDMPFVLGQGCERCHFIGYRGRALVADLWLPDQQDTLLIMRKAPFEDIRESARRTTISMAQDAHALLLDCRTTLEELARVLPYSAIAEHRDRARGRSWD
jgi:type IV pilus assembly protein PilB